MGVSGGFPNPTLRPAVICKASTADKDVQMLELESRPSAPPTGDLNGHIHAAGAEPAITAAAGTDSASARTRWTPARTASARATASPRTDTGLLGAWTSRLAGCRTLTTWAIHHVERERPHVIAGLALVGPDRSLLALARNTHDAAADEAARRTGWRRGCGTTAPTRGGPRRRRPESAGRSSSATGRLLTGPTLGISSLRISLRVSDRHETELAILRHRVLELLPQVLPLNEV